MKKEPRILVVSNNSFSDVKNNGKTLASFFKGFSPDNIFQLYFSPEIPSKMEFKNFFRITDKEMVDSILKKKEAGRIIDIFDQNEKNIEVSKNNLNKSQILRIARELIWWTKKWKTAELDNWLDNVNPDIIFFCAGDSGFAYDIVEYIKKKYSSKTITYITDDYILPRRTLNLFWWIRRNFIFSKMEKNIKNCDLFMTISEKMQVTYKKIFGKDSFLIINMTESMKDEALKMEKKERIKTLVYTGGLHFNRDKTLRLIAESLQKYNKENQKQEKFILNIYSTQNLTEQQKEYLSLEDVSKFCGGLNRNELKVVLNNADYLVHVESFDKHSIESTRLSISTKIPEYLSLGKPIIAVGPGEIASMECLENVAYCIKNSNDIDENLKIFLNKNPLQELLSQKAFEHYKKKYDSKKMLHELRNEILRVR